MPVHTRPSLRERHRQSRVARARIVIGLSARVSASMAVATAQTAFAESTGDAKASARSKALEGSRLADQGQHQRALDLFREAYAVYPEPAYLYDIGVECQALGRDVEALDAYARFLADPKTSPRDLVSHASELRAELEKRLGEIQLRGAPPGADVDVDDEPRGTVPLAAPMRANAGAHRVTLRRPGFMPFRADVRVPEGGSVFVDVPELAPSDPALSAGPAPKPWVSWAFSLGLGFWTAGPPPDSGPSPAFALGAGHSLASLPGDIDFELGAKVAFTYFTEPRATDTFLSFLVNPRFTRPFGDRWRAFAELGAGVLVLGGVPDNSVLLEPKGGRVTGALAAFELRPAVGAAYAVTDAIVFHVAPAFVWNPSPNERFDDAALTRVELGIGVGGGL
jgi:hypothetical protein